MFLVNSMKSLYRLLERIFENFSTAAIKVLGNSITFLIAVILVIVYLATQHVYNENFHDVIYDIILCVTFLGFFIIQKSFNKYSTALHLKMNELLAAHEQASNHMVNIENKTERIDNLVALAHKYKLHVSLNLHRAPGYCINAGFNEPFNLWKDEAAQNAFYFHWNMWAKRYKNVSSKKISFDLVNEPAMREDMNDQHSKSGPIPGEIYRKVAAGAAAAIKKENKKHLIIADGNSGGSAVIPELVDLDIAQSCRGYYPGQISHYKAPWANKDPEHSPEPKWPGQIGSTYWDKTKLEAFYKPWIDLANKGVGVHCGECGCWKKTPHDVFLAWFGDVLEILTKNGIGYALWEFSGDFGLLNSGREDVAYENWYGQKLDRKLLSLLQKY